MIRFANSEILMFIPFLLVFFIFAIFTVKRSQRTLQKYYHSAMLGRLISSISLKKRKMKIFLEFLALILLTLSYARLQMGEGSENVKAEGIELIMVIDVSNSMLAEDLKPSRLEYTKAQSHRFLDQISGHKAGLIAFAGSAALLSPLTPDYSALRMYLDSLSTKSVSSQGTNYERALRVAADAFRGGSEEKETKKMSRAIIIFSDGENHEQGAVDLAKKLNEEGIYIYTIGIGSREGAKIPLRDKFGYLKGHKKDDSGNEIVTKAMPQVLKDIASAGGGSYYHASFGSNHIESIVNDLNQLEKMEFDSDIARNYTEYFQVFLIIALIFAFFELLLSETNAKKRLWRGRFQGDFKS